MVKPKTRTGYQDSKTNHAGLCLNPVAFPCCYKPGLVFFWCLVCPLVTTSSLSLLSSPSNPSPPPSRAVLSLPSSIESCLPVQVEGRHLSSVLRRFTQPRETWREEKHLPVGSCSPASGLLCWASPFSLLRSQPSQLAFLSYLGPDSFVCQSSALRAFLLRHADFRKAKEPSRCHPTSPSTQPCLKCLPRSSSYGLVHGQFRASRRLGSQALALASDPPLRREDSSNDKSADQAQKEAAQTSLLLRTENPGRPQSSSSHTSNAGKGTTPTTQFFFTQAALSPAGSSRATLPSSESPPSSVLLKEEPPSLSLGLPKEVAQLDVATQVKKTVSAATEGSKTKLDVRMRRRLKEIIKITRRGQSARERLKQDLAREDEIAKDPELASRRAEELRRLRLEDPLTRPVERRRYTVQWWPNFAREALPRILAALPHVDLIVEVRDARLPLLTQLPLQPPEGGQKPRLIVLTHADQASEAGNAQWARYFRFLYRLHAAEAFERDEDRSGSLMAPKRVLQEPSIRQRGSEGELQAEDGARGEGDEGPGRIKLMALDRQGEGAGHSLDSDDALPLVPPVPPVVPVLFVNAQQGGACIVRVEKAARKIVKKWREYRRDVEVYRHRLKEALKVRKAALQKPGDLSFTDSDVDKDAEELGVTGSAEPQTTPDIHRGEQVSLPGNKYFQRRGMKTQKGRRQRYKERSVREDRQLLTDGDEEKDAAPPGTRAPSSSSRTTAARGSLRAKRPLRLLVVGMPNVGKSALCNRLLGTKKARSYNYPGVTKVLTWYRRRGTFFQTNLHRLFDCVDTPGLLPPPSTSLLRPGGRGTVISRTTPTTRSQTSSSASPLVSFPPFKQKKKKQEKAPSIRAQHSVSNKQFFLRDHPVWADDDSIRLLASLNKIPQSCLFTIEEAAVAFLNQVFKVWVRRPAFIPLTRFAERYKVDPLARGVTLNELNGCEYLHRLAAKNHHYCTGAATQRLLTDVAKGYLGRMTLEVPPSRQEIVSVIRAVRTGVRGPTEEELKREQAREAIRRDRMHGGSDRQVSSDWHLLVQNPEEEDARRPLLWNVRKIRGSNQEETTAEEQGREGGMEEEQERGEDPRAKKQRRKKATRLEFATATGCEGADGEGNQRSTAEKIDGHGEPEDTRAVRNSSDRHLVQKAATDKKQKQAQADSDEQKKTHESSASLVLNDGTVKRVDCDQSLEQQASPGVSAPYAQAETETDSEMEHSDRREKSGNPVQLSEGKSGLRSLSTRKRKYARTNPSSTVRTVFTESPVNPARNASRGQLLDERLRTELEERSWEAGDFEGW